MRLAALRVPDFPVQALRRSSPELAEAPVAVAAGGSPRDPIVAVAAEAVEMGVLAGMTAAQARQRTPDVLVCVPAREVLEATDEALADVAGRFSPRVKRLRMGEVVLDASGLTPRWGSEGNIADELLRTCRRVGLDAHVGIAASADVALVASRLDEAVVVEEGREALLLASLPISLLEPEPAVAEALVRWGVSSAGDLARLARKEVTLRLGQAGAALHRLACGEGITAFIADPPAEVLREGIALDHALVALEAFLFVLHGLLSRLASRLELRGEGFAEVLLELHLEGAGNVEYRLKLVAPAREVAAVLALARLQLEARPPGGAVESITAQVTPGRVRMMQGSLFAPPQPAPGKLATTLARLAALVGPERLGAPGIPDTHRPGVWNVLPFSPPPVQGTGDRVPGTGNRPPVLRAFRPARRAHVAIADGRPVVARVDGTGGVVVGLAGPYRFIGDWWGEEPFSRDDFDVATADGFLFRLFFDRRQKLWFADGVYD